ncbi:GyrI-like domain-containing protein [Paraclostridium sp. AKS73]|uniref:GyrI-like domain-containing protein n=1 Tax=Paraclostridium sp. AKS73 TaxID=2876116 RepID=UPI002FCD3BCC
MQKEKIKSIIRKVELKNIKEGTSVQMLHVGPYDDEPRTFSAMEEFCNENNLKIKTKAHREIYLSDFRKTEAAKLKTVLRYMVEEN